MHFESLSDFFLPWVATHHTYGVRLVLLSYPC